MMSSGLVEENICVYPGYWITGAHVFYFSISFKEIDVQVQQCHIQSIKQVRCRLLFKCVRGDEDFLAVCDPPAPFPLQLCSFWQTVPVERWVKKPPIHISQVQMAMESLYFFLSLLCGNKYSVYIVYKLIKPGTIYMYICFINGSCKMWFYINNLSRVLETKMAARPLQ